MGKTLSFLKSPLLWLSLVVLATLYFLPGFVSGYILGLLTVAFYFAVFSMSWDLLFGFAGEVNFGPSFLVGLGAYTAGMLDYHFGTPIWLCLVAGAVVAVIGGFVLALPALRVTGPYFSLTTLVAVLIMQNLIIVFAGATGGEIGLVVPDIITFDTTANYYIALGFMTVERRHPLRPVALALRADPAGGGPGRGRDGGARLQRRQAQARRLLHQRLLLGPLRRAAHLLHGHGVGRHDGGRSR